MKRDKALAGLRIADFSWQVTGPTITLWLADHGAEVVKVESPLKPDQTRVYTPFAGGIPGINRSGQYSNVNCTKYSMYLDLKHPQGVEVARKLVTWSNLVIESFTPGKMAEWGLGYDDLKRIKPNIIMLAITQQGQTGPYSQQAGLGNVIQGASGLPSIVGWPDRGALGVNFGPYNDYIAPWYGLIALMAALEHRRRTGEGMYIDLSNIATGVAFKGPAILDCTANGRLESQTGNASLRAAPHGAYRCKGDDRWVAISIFTDREWSQFCRAIGNPAWARNNKFSTLLNRKANEDDLNRLVEAWTVNHTAEEVTEHLQKAGIAAEVVQNARDLLEDVQLRNRDYYTVVDHPEIGRHHVESEPFKLSKTRSRKRPAPLAGEHTEYVCTHLLGLTDMEFVNLAAQGAFF